MDLDWRKRASMVVNYGDRISARVCDGGACVGMVGLGRRKRKERERELF